MTDIIVEIMVEILTILANATKEVKRGRLSELMSYRLAFVDLVVLEKYLKKLTGNTDIEDGLAKLDKLTQEEARMASAEQLKMMHSVKGTVEGVDDKIDQVNRSSSL